jgi:hypothetical protein
MTHEVTKSGSDRAQLASIAKQAKAVLQTETLDAVADRGYFNSPEILACHEAGITVTLPKPGREIGRPFWQAGLRLSRRRGCLSMSGWRAAHLSLHE